MPEPVYHFSIRKTRPPYTTWEYQYTRDCGWAWRGSVDKWTRQQDQQVIELLLAVLFTPKDYKVEFLQTPASV